MFRLIAPLVLTLAVWCSSAAAGEPWAPDERVLGAAAAGALTVDWLQSRYIARHPEFHESNQIMGPHPSISAVNAYFASSAIAGYFIADALPHSWRRAALAGALVLELVVVGHNKRIGIGLSF